MSSVTLPVYAGILGSFYFGPTGGALVYAATSAYLAENDDPTPPRIGDLRVQTSSYGTAIPNVIGRQRLAGNIIFAEDKVEHTDTIQTGKGGGPEQEIKTFSVTMAILICQGPIKGIQRVWADGDLIVDGRGDGSPPTPVAKNMPGELYLGTETQTPDPTMEASALGGVGNVPAYRGLAYMVFNNFDLGVSGRVPFFSFEVLKEGSDL